MARIVSTKILIGAWLVIFIGIMFIVDMFNVFNWTHRLEPVPVVGQYFAESTEEEQINEETYLLEQQVSDLEQQLLEANRDLTDALNENRNLVNQASSLEGRLDEVEAQNKELLAQKMSYEELADYYSGMRAENAVKILNELTITEVIGILREMNSDQVARILSEMESNRAAQVTRSLLGN
ncbi:flagellar motility protein MotE (MotC chaperone) [Desulfitispora alkaliphila]|uniref:MotE family protein n=1 Tax=Desulfitispora alkaliphila TaxID=622674 RepID=UPI003D1D04F1